MGKKRVTREHFQGNAWAAVGKLSRGMEVVGFTKGQFSLIHLVMACLEQTGPADVVIASWTAAKKEILTANRLMKTKLIRKCRWLVDFSFPRQQPIISQILREKFGDDCIRVTKTHAKFVLIRNGKWNLAIRTSMNMNTNPRFEGFEISDDARLCDFFEGVVDMVIEAGDAGEAFGERPGYHVRKFDQLGVEVKGMEDTAIARLGVCLDNPGKPGMEVL